LTWGFTGAPPGTRTPNPRIKSSLLSSMIPRYYLRLHGCTSEDTSLPRVTSYRMMTAATGPYQRIRASMERAIWSIGLNQSHRTRRTRQSVPTWRATQGSTECDCQRRSSAVACLRCAFRVISDKGAPVTCADRTCTCAVPIVYLAWTCGLSRGSRVRPSASGRRRPETWTPFWHPTGDRGEGHDHGDGRQEHLVAGPMPYPASAACRAAVPGETATARRTSAAAATGTTSSGRHLTRRSWTRDSRPDWSTRSPAAPASSCPEHRREG
jgi:hypothetical protein